MLSYGCTTKKPHPINQPTNQKTTHKPKKQKTKQKKSPNKLATGTQLIREIDVTVKPSKTKPQTKPRQT